jgi:hypothetical protein
LGLGINPVEADLQVGLSMSVRFAIAAVVAGHSRLDDASAARIRAGRHSEERMTGMLTRDGKRNRGRIRCAGDPALRRVSRDGVTNDASKFLLVHWFWSG